MSLVGGDDHHRVGKNMVEEGPSLGKGILIQEQNRGKYLTFEGRSLDQGTGRGRSFIGGPRRETSA